ncbi:MAG: leucine-rich repeat domain-containing protein [Promethearchaeota archaeon]
METLTNIRSLSLNGSQISTIAGLETQTNLTELHLEGNQITEIKGLETLTKLIGLGLERNQITELENIPDGENQAKYCVKYCQKNPKLRKDLRSINFENSKRSSK